MSLAVTRRRWRETNLLHLTPYFVKTQTCNLAKWRLMIAIVCSCSWRMRWRAKPFSLGAEQPGQEAVVHVHVLAAIQILYIPKTTCPCVLIVTAVTATASSWKLSGWREWISSLILRLIRSWTSVFQLLEYPGEWLRASCECESCFSPHTLSRKQLFEPFVQEEVKLVSVNLSSVSFADKSLRKYFCVRLKAVACWLCRMEVESSARGPTVTVTRSHRNGCTIGGSLTAG